MEDVPVRTFTTHADMATVEIIVNFVVDVAQEQDILEADVSII
jgi:hypothetical protein